MRWKSNNRMQLLRWLCAISNDDSKYRSTNPRSSWSRNIGAESEIQLDTVNLEKMMIVRKEVWIKRVFSFMTKLGGTTGNRSTQLWFNRILCTHSTLLSNTSRWRRWLDSERDWISESNNSRICRLQIVRESDMTVTEWPWLCIDSIQYKRQTARRNTETPSSKMRLSFRFRVLTY